MRGGKDERKPRGAELEAGVSHEGVRDNVHRCGNMHYVNACPHT